MTLIPTEYQPIRGVPAPRIVPVVGGKVHLRLKEYLETHGFVHTGGQWAGRPRMTVLARLSGLNYTTVHLLINHPEDTQTISFSVLAKLCAALNCQPGDLLYYERQLPRPISATPTHADNPDSYTTEASIHREGDESAVVQW